MKIYKCIKVDSENGSHAIGKKFFIYDGILYPWKTTNGVGIELNEVGLESSEKFEEYFEVCEEVGLDQIPMLRIHKENLIKKRDSLKKEVSDIEEELAELEASESKIQNPKELTDAELFTEFFNLEKKPFRLMSESAKKVLLQHSKWVEWYSKDAQIWVPVFTRWDAWNDEAYRLPLAVISFFAEGYRVKKLSGKPFKSGNKIGTIKAIVVNEQCPNKRLAYTFEEDNSCVNIGMCEVIKEHHHPFCNFWNGPVSKCKQCKGLYERYGDKTPNEIIEEI